MTKRTEKPAITHNNAVELLQSEIKQNQMAYRKAYVELCKEHKFQLVGVPIFIPNSTGGYIITVKQQIIDFVSEE